MRRTAWLGLLSAAFCLTASCAGEGDGPSGPDLDQLPALLAEAICEPFTSCVGRDLMDRIFGPEGCVKRTRGVIEDGDFPFIEDAIDRDRVTYSPEKVEQCLARISELGCDYEITRIMTVSPCDEVLVGSLAPGEYCSVDAECSDSAFCKISGSCPGVCTTLLTAGEECGETDDCRNGLVCSEVSNTCVAPADRGEACGGAEARQCKLGLSCVGEGESSNQAGTCKSQDEILQGKEGDPCDLQSSDLCDDGLSCAISDTTGASTFTCTAKVGSDEPCRLAAPTQCPDGEYCSDMSLQASPPDLQGTCKPLPGAGKPCADDPVGPEAGSCAAGLFCETDNRCHPVNRLGEPCVSDDGCASETCKEGVCVRPEQCEP